MTNKHLEIERVNKLSIPQSAGLVKLKGGQNVALLCNMLITFS
jgi:hypothetical protein